MLNDNHSYTRTCQLDHAKTVKPYDSIQIYLWQYYFMINMYIIQL